MTDLITLKEKFHTANINNQLLLIEQFIEYGEEGYQFLREFLEASQDKKPDFLRGKVYQLLYKTENQINQDFLKRLFNHGIINLKSEQNIDYQTLQQLLIEQKYQEADTLTRVKLQELVGENAIKRKWIYFTEIDKLPSTDLDIIDQLWNTYSEGKFGFRVQRKIWLSLGKDFNKLWTKINWKNDNKWTKYPQEFIWDLTAPIGHLPLSNQLRGVREIDSLFNHPVWLD